MQMAQRSRLEFAGKLLIYRHLCLQTPREHVPVRSVAQ